MGNPDQAREAHQSALAWAAETGDAGMLIESQSLGARLALLQGKAPDVSRWAGVLGDSVPLMLLLHIPQLTLANVLLAQGTLESLREVEGLLTGLRQSANDTHNTWRRMEIRAMESLLKAAEGDHEGARTLLTEVVQWAYQQGYIRLFTDMGPKMAELLDPLRHQDGIKGSSTSDFITELLTTFDKLPPKRAGASAQNLIEPLTNRELDVLELLAQRLSNKEIAAQLVISPLTVKKHTVRIYQKLGVKNRRQATEKARTLGLVSDR